MKTRLRMKCMACGNWNRFEVNKLFVEQPTSEPKVRAFIKTYEPLKVEKCKKYGKLIAEPKESISIRISGTNLLRTVRT
jgi:hypothetical protein